MTTAELLSTLRRLDVHLLANGDRLHCNAPPGVLTPALQAEITQRKDEILAVLRQVQSPERVLPPPIRPVPRGGELPLAFPQQRLWFLDQLQPESAPYHVTAACCLHGELDVALLAQSLAAIVERHDVLRSTFATVDGRPLQVIAPHLELPLPVFDLRGLSAAVRRAEVKQQLASEAERSFHLARGPLLRTILLWMDDTEHILHLTMHHIISDGWSSRLFWHEMATIYEALSTGTPPKLPQLPIQYADFAHWQLEWLQGEALERLLAYWTRQLDGAPTVLELLTDHPRPAIQTFRGVQRSLTLSVSLSESLKALSQSAGVTLFMTLLAAFNILLSRYTGQNDILVGSPIAGRTRPETEPLIGFFINYLVLRTDLSGNPTFWQLLQRVRDVSLEAYAHQDLPFELLIEAIRPERDLSRTPLFQVFFNMHNFGAGQINLPGLTIDIFSPHDPAARFDLSLYATERPEGIQLAFFYNADLFEDATITHMLRHFQTLLEGVAADPAQHLSQLPFLTASQRQQLASGGNMIRPVNTFSEFDKTAIEQSIPARFAEQVKRYPDRLAIKTQAEAWTYQWLDHLSNGVAQALFGLRGGGQERVALLFDHDPRMIASIFGVLKAGKAYVPLDPLYPRERLAYVLEDSQAGVILTHHRQLTLAYTCAQGGQQIIDVDAIAPCAAHDHTQSPIAPGALAYILYTSGSTGRPKGVLQTHRNVLHFCCTYTNSLHLGAADRLTLLFTYISDGAVMDIFGALLNGATLYPFDLRAEELTRLRTWLQREEISVYHSTPTVYRQVMRTLAAEQFPALRLVVLGGEAVYRTDVELYHQLFPEDCLLVNGLGPTESTLALQFFLDKHTEVMRHAVPVGYPVAGTEILVLDQTGESVHGYGVGEIAIRSPAIALGYWRQPAQTATAFQPDPAGGSERVYRTGDLGRWLPDGSLEFMGRKDWQVKVRGYRVELGEIEITLGQHPSIREAVVIARDEELGNVSLVAYIVFEQASPSSNRELRRWLRAKLPAYMIPSVFVRLDALPLTSSGKIDRLALPLPSQVRPEVPEAFVGPRTPTEEVLAGIWSSVLGIDEMGIYDNFFDLGGHSLLAVQATSRIREALQVEIPVRAIFEAPTIAALTLSLETTHGAVVPVSGPVLARRPPEEAKPASIAQEQFWSFDQIVPGIPLFNIPFVIHLQGILDAAILEQSFKALIRRQAALRTIFTDVEGQLLQMIAPTLHSALTLWDLRACPEPERGDEARRLMQEESQCPFDMMKGPLLRGSLLRLSEQEHLLLVTLHHMICDGWSLGILVHELAVLYEAIAADRPSPLPALPIQYTDFAYWQRHWRANPVLEAQLAYWRAHLHNLSPVIELPTDRPRGRLFSVRTARQPLEFPNRLLKALRDCSRQEGCTLFMTCLAAVKILLYSYTGQEDTRVATLLANRTHQETEEVIGLFVNTVILRTHLGGNPTGQEVLHRVRATTLAAYAHQELPFEELVCVLEQEHQVQRTSLCQLLVIWQNTMLRPIQCSTPMLTFQPVEHGVVPPEVALTTFDIILELRERPRGLLGTCIYKTELFEASTIAQMLDAFLDVLSRLITHPEQSLATFRPLQGEQG